MNDANSNSTNPNPAPITQDPSPISPTPAPAKKKYAPRGLIAKKNEIPLSKAEKVAGTALKAAYAATLADSDITAPFIQQILTDCATARGNLGGALNKTTDKLAATGSETSIKQQLIGQIQVVQAAARQKYAATAPEQLADYHSGTKLANNRPGLEQAAADVINKLKTDTLPGIKPADIQRLKDLAAAYKAADLDQAGQQSAATTSRLTGEALIADITKRRHQIQYAADAQWPHANKLNAPIRREFDLPTTRPFVP